MENPVIEKGIIPDTFRTQDDTSYNFDKYFSDDQENDQGQNKQH
jgi:hypothetical protein